MCSRCGYASVMEELVSKKGTKSVVWDYFGLRKKNGEVIDDGSAVCRACRRTVAAKQGNTSNLLAHLRVHHCKLHSEVTALVRSGKRSREVMETTSKVPDQPTLGAVLEVGQQYEKKGKKWKALTDAVTYFIAKDGQPMLAVDKPGFRSMLKTFDSRYQPPSRKYFSNTAIPSLYATERAKLQEELSSSVKFYSGTTDLWSSAGMKPYISYTIHYINSDWKLTSKCLQSLFLPEDHTSEVIADSLKTTLESWSLSADNQVCLTTDSGSNIIKAARDLHWLRLACFGHNLHLSVTKAMDGEPRCHRALGVCRKIVSAFHTSWKRKRELSKSLINMNLKDRALVSVS